MAHRAVMESMILKQAWRISINRTSLSLFHSHQKNQTPILSSRCGDNVIKNIRYFCLGRRIDEQIKCSRDKNPSPSPSLAGKNMQQPLAEANLKINSEMGKSEGQTTDMVFGSTVIDGSSGEWLTLNEKINTYPSARRFTAIGTGGDDFVRSMIVAVESVIQHRIPQDYVKQRVSSRGKYVSVNIGPVRVVSREQVEAVYKAMRSDERMKFFL